MNWIDGSIEFKCVRGRSASCPDTAEITLSAYRFPKKGLTLTNDLTNSLTV